MDHSSLSKLMCRQLFNWGHYWSPLALELSAGAVVKSAEEAEKLGTDSLITMAAMKSLCELDSHAYQAAGQRVYGRAVKSDGVFGPAIQAMILTTKRCSVPDFVPPSDITISGRDVSLGDVIGRMRMDASTALPARGKGNWPGCHGIGNFHAAMVQVDMRGLPNFLAPHFQEILRRVRNAYAALGCRFIFVDNDHKDLLTGKRVDGHVDINFSWVDRSDGWIGLATVANGVGCGDSNWCQYLGTYRGGSSAASIIAQWVSLIKHELGHNCGIGHTRGGVMNSSIVTGLAPEWSLNDPARPLLVDRFGGQPVPVDDTPPPEPEPDDFELLQHRVDQLEADASAQFVMNRLLMQRVLDLEARQ